MKGKITRRKSPLIQKILNETTPQERTTTVVRMSIAARLDDSISAKGWSHQEFAVRFDKSPFEIAEWFSGTHNFTIEELARIAFMLEVEITDLFR